MAEALTEASRNCGANGRNTYLVIFCWLMKYLAVRPQSLVLIGAASLRELYFLHIMNLAGVRIVYVSYGMDKDFDKFPHANRVQNMTGSMSGMIQMDFSHIDLSKAAQMSQMRASAQQVENTVQRLSTTAAGIFEDFMTEHRTRVVKNGGVFREGGVIPVYFAALIGYDEEAVYNNMLLKFKEGFAGSKKQLIFIEKPMENPTAEEIRQLGTVSRNSTGEMIDELALLIKLNGDPIRTALAQTELRKLLNRALHRQSDGGFQLRKQAYFLAVPLHPGAEVRRAVRGYSGGAVLRGYLAVGAVFPAFHVAVRVRCYLHHAEQAASGYHGRQEH